MPGKNLFELVALLGANAQLVCMEQEKMPPELKWGPNERTELWNAAQEVNSALVKIKEIAKREDYQDIVNIFGTDV